MPEAYQRAVFPLSANKIDITTITAIPASATMKAKKPTVFFRQLKDIFF